MNWFFGPKDDSPRASKMLKIPELFQEKATSDLDRICPLTSIPAFPALPILGLGFFQKSSTNSILCCQYSSIVKEFFRDFGSCGGTAWHFACPTSLSELQYPSPFDC